MSARPLPAACELCGAFASLHRGPPTWARDTARCVAHAWADWLAPWPEQRANALRALTATPDAPRETRSPASTKAPRPSPDTPGALL